MMKDQKERTKGRRERGRKEEGERVKKKWKEG